VSESGDCDAGLVEQFNELPDFAGDDGERAEVPPPQRAIARLADGRCASICRLNSSSCSSATSPARADQLQVGRQLVRRVIQWRVDALGLEEIGAERVSVGGSVRSIQLTRRTGESSRASAARTARTLRGVFRVRGVRVVRTHGR